MSAASPALLAAAAGVGFGHAILPEHWLPLSLVGRARRYPLSRVARLSVLAGVAHVLVSIVLGALIIVVGLRFRSTLESSQDTIIGVILIVTGVGFAVIELSGRGHSHHGHEPARASSPAEAPGLAHRARGLAGIMVPFGAAASPDLTILPVFLAATAAGAATAIGSVIVFAAVTIGTIVGLTLLACFSGYQIRGAWLERWGNALTAVVLVLIGALVLSGAI